jgi:hypothetical protein
MSPAEPRAKNSSGIKIFNDHRELAASTLNFEHLAVDPRGHPSTEALQTASWCYFQKVSHHCVLETTVCFSAGRWSSYKNRNGITRVVTLLRFYVHRDNPDLIIEIGTYYVYVSKLLEFVTEISDHLSFNVIRAGDPQRNPNLFGGFRMADCQEADAETDGWKR